MSEFRNRIFATTVGLLFLITLVPVGTQAQVVPPEVNDPIRNDRGPDAPFGTWERFYEQTTFFLDADGTPAEGWGDASDTIGAGEFNTLGLGILSFDRNDTEVDDGCASVDEDPTGEIGSVGTPACLYDDPNDKKVGLDHIDDADPGPISEPAGGTQVVPGVFPDNSVAVFTMPESMVSDDIGYRIKEVSATIYANCAGAGDPTLAPVPSSVGMNVEVHVLKQDGTRRDHTGGNDGVKGLGGDSFPIAPLVNTPDTVTAFSGSMELTWNPAIDVSNSGQHIRAGEKIEIELSIDQDAPCRVHFGSFDYSSHFTIVADTGRVNAWVEDRSAFGDVDNDGQFAFGLPAAEKSASSERRFSAQVVHASLLPGRNVEACGYDEDDDDNDIPGTADTRCLLEETYNDYGIRFRELETNDLWYHQESDGDVPVGTGAEDVQVQAIRSKELTDDPRGSLQRIQYDFTYPPTLPEGEFRFEVYHPSFGFATSPVVIFGLKGIALDFIGNEVHEVNLGQPTEFRFTTKNIGAEDDTVIITVSQPGGNWEVDIDDRFHFLKANGGESTFTVTLTPPSTGITAGDTKSVTVTAISQNFDEVDPVSKSVTAEVKYDCLVTTSGCKVDHGVDIDADFSEIDIAPGQEVRVTGVRVTNLGTAQDNFLVQPSVPAANPGWIVTAVPPSVSPKAGSIEDVELIIQAPTTVATGTEIPLSLDVVRVGDSTVSDIMVVNLVVDLVLDVVLDSDFASAKIRTKSLPYCPGEEVPDLSGAAGSECSQDYVEDADADASALFEVAITNPGPQAETYTVRSSWFAGSGLNGGCDGSGSPDFWRVRLGEADDIGDQAPTAKSVSTQVTVPAGGTETRYVQLGYSMGSITPIFDPFLGLLGCPGSDPNTVSDDAGLRLAIRSTADSALEDTIDFYVERVEQSTAAGPNQYPATTHGTAALLPLDDPTAFRGVQAGESDSHSFEARNTGNEFDNITVSVQQDTSGDFTRSLEYVGSIPVDPPADPRCTSQNADDTSWFCTGMGVHDVALFDLVVEADQDLLVGDRDIADVRVTSVSDGSKIDSLRFTTDVVGEFLFSGTGLVANKDVRTEDTALLPFAIRNLGTADDTYTVSLLDGEADYLPRLSETSVFVPAGKNHFGSLAVTVPSGEPLDSEATFLLRIASQGDPGRQANVGFTTTVVSTTSLTLAGDPSNTVDIVDRGVATRFTVTATDPDAGAGDTVDFTRSSVPLGWSITNVTATDDVLFDSNGEASVTYEITVPEDALASSRLPVHIVADSSSGKSDGTDIVFRLADTFGLSAERIDEEINAIVPGGRLAYQVRVTNRGLSADTVLLSTTSITEEGWTVQFDPAQVNLGPLESRIVDVLVDAPSTAPANQSIAFSLIAQSENDPAEQIQVPFTVLVGSYDLGLDKVPTGDVSVAPGGSGSFVFTVNNTGNLVDEVSVSAVLDSLAYEDDSSLTVTPATFDLDPGATRDVLVEWSVGRGIPSEVDLSATFRFESLLAPTTAPVDGSATFGMETFRFVRDDVDGDGLDEFAIDRDQDSGSGFESFLDIYDGTGKRTQSAALTQFLTDEARESFNVQITNATGETVTVFRFVLDGDGDGRVDHMLDDDGDGLPDQYWDPDRGLVSQLDTFKDVDADQVPDYFVDLDGDGRFDVVYLLSQGRFVPLLQRDVDNDGILDYVVDADEDGELDADETVLLSRSGGLLTVQKIDVTGNGELDSVFDLDGDGIPEYFIPAGSEDSIEIVLRDVDGDGEQDWTYDADGDGKRESYYSPATQESGLIDSEGVFLDSLGEYWYVGAIFGVVLVLFIILMAVTRR